ncbi:MAG: two-component system sensor histidine kinase NtrB, partial [Nannocystaceae bacterium]
GHLRAVESIELSRGTLFILGAYLVGYTVFVTHIVHTSVRLSIRARNELAEKTRRLEGLHEHLLESIATPYVSDTEILELIGDKLSDEQVDEYRARLRSRQRLENLGRRAAVVSHDLRNLLQPITLSSELLHEELAAEQSDTELVDDIVLASRRATDLVRSSSASSPAIKQSAPCHVVREVASLLLSRARGSAVDVKCLIDGAIDDDPASASPPRVPIDSDALHRALMNLGVNALQALDGAGSLTLTAHRLSGEEVAAVAPLPPTIDPANAILLTVEDDGPGMSPETLERVFEPYFTTRPKAGGTGLGLSTTFALVADAGGVLRVHSQEGHGTTFRIVLAAIEPAQFQKELASAPATPPALAR